MKSNVILDASALLALIKDEPGGNIVENLLGNIIMSSLNVSEVAAILLDLKMSLKECQDSILPFISLIIPFDEEHAFYTANLKKQTQDKGLSLGDRACIALGQIMQLPIYTADQIWGQLKLDKADIKLIR